MPLEEHLDEMKDLHVQFLVRAHLPHILIEDALEYEVAQLREGVIVVVVTYQEVDVVPGGHALRHKDEELQVFVYLGIRAAGLSGLAVGW